MSTNAQNIEELKSDRGVLVLKQTLGSDILQSFYQFFKLTETHDRTNDIFKKLIGELLQTLNTWIGLPEMKSMNLTMSGDQFFLNEIRIRPRPRNIDKLKFLLKFLRKRRVLALTITRQTTFDRLEAVLWCIALLKKDQSIVDIEAQISALGFDEFEFRSLAFQSVDKVDAKSLAQDIYNQLHQFSGSCFENLDEALQKPAPKLDTLLDSLSLVEEADLLNLFCLNRAQSKGRPLATIATNSAFMMYAWGKNLGLPLGVISEMAGAGLAHPLVLLHQPKGHFDLRAHERCSLGMSTLKKVQPIWPLTQLQILSCLEWSVLFGENGVYQISNRKCYQHFFSRMLRIVVLFQQMQVLEPQLPPEKAVARLLNPSLGCDLSLARLFIHWIGITPVGSFVQLNTGEIGQICSTSGSLVEDRRPMVGVYKTKAGELLDQPRIIDLGDISTEDPNRYAYSVEKALPPAEAQIPLDKIQLLGNSMLLAMSY